MPKSMSLVDPNGLIEYSVVYTERPLNHMSISFQEVMREISRTLKKVYNAHLAAIVPGGGTYAMEAVARQFATNKKTLVVRNGGFSFRWTQIFEMIGTSISSAVLKARQDRSGSQAAFTPAPLKDVVASINAEKPDFVFATHVETSANIILPDTYIKEVGVDILISAPQKGWSASRYGGLVLLSKFARIAIDKTTSTSFAIDLKRWLEVMEAYEAGSYAYHSTLPTDAIVKFHSAMKEAEAFDFDKIKQAQKKLGLKVPSFLNKKQFRSVASEGFETPSVIVYYTD
jgi:aspartate aminotransferase-like enzyme